MSKRKPTLHNAPETYITASFRKEENNVCGGSDYPTGNLGVMTNTKNDWRKRHNEKECIVSRVSQGTIDTTRLCT